MKKMLSLMLVFVLITAMLAGCSTGTEDVTPSEEPSEDVEAPAEEVEEETSEPAKLKITSGLWSQPQEQQFIREEILPGFEEKYNAEVELEVIDNIEKVMEAQKQSGEWTSDIVMTHSGSMPNYIENGYVQAIDEIKEESGLTFLDAFESATTSNGKTYYLPISADVYLVIANNDALEYLPEGVDVESLTWEQYKDWAINMAENVGPKVSFPLKAVTSSPYEFGGIGLSYGSEFPSVNSDGMKEVWGLYGEMVKNEAILKTSFNYGNPIDQMKSGEAWLSFYHMVPIGDIYSSAPAKYTVIPAPAGPTGNGSIAGAWGMGITEGTENKELAEKFVKYLTSPEVLYQVSAGTGGFIPPVEEVIAELGKEPKDVIMKMGLNTLNNGIVSGVPASDYTDWGAVKSVFDTVAKKIWDDNGEFTNEYLDQQQVELENLEK